jgi:hypothetical protein
MGMQLNMPSAIIAPMSFLQSLRNARHLTRFMLVWFALFIGVAAASPLVKPQTAQMICSTMGGVQMVLTDEGGGTPVASADGMDCPLCTQVSVPLPTAMVGFVPVSSLAHAMRPLAVAHIAWLTGTPLPPRGPPSLS